jgi:hypothetical protein
MAELVDGDITKQRIDYIGLVTEYAELELVAGRQF